MTTTKLCSICNSEKKVVNTKMGLLCGKHSLQFYRYGTIKTRTKYDSNEIIKYNDRAEIIIYDKNCNEKARAIIDLNNIDTVSSYKWSLTSDNYVLSHKTKKYIYLHRLLTSCTKDMYVDHINHNTLDNRLINLRIVTNAENLQNRVGLQSNNKTGVNGVSFSNNRQKWQVDIQTNGKRTFGGYFDTKEEAIIKREQLEIEQFKHKQ